MCKIARGTRNKPNKVKIATFPFLKIEIKIENPIITFTLQLC